MSRQRKGVLPLRGSGWFARLTFDVEGESIRKWFDLQTQNPQVAKRKMARLVKQHATDQASPAALPEGAKVLETYAEAAAQIRAQRRAEGVRDVMNEDIRDKLYLIPAIATSATCARRTSARCSRRRRKRARATRR